VDEEGGAAVRVAMTVMTKAPVAATLVKVGETAAIASERHVPRLNTDMSADADISDAAKRPLHANAGISSFGFMLAGAGFILDPDEAERLLAMDFRHPGIGMGGI
jgi:hypothetical protein